MTQAAALRGEVAAAEGQSRRSERVAHRAALGVLAASLLAYGVLALGYGTRTPIWQNPDEPAHYNYIAQVAATGTLPELRPGDWDSALLERVKTGRLAPGDDIGTIRYESWQPPLYYIVAAPVLRFAPRDVEARVLTLRLFDALLGGATLVVAYAAARHLFPHVRAAAVPLVIAGVPMFTAVSASVSADPLANLLAAVFVFVLLRALAAQRLSLRWSIGTGALLGLGLLTKLALGIFVPLAVGVLLVRSRPVLTRVVQMLVTAAIVLVPWLVHQVTAYGWTDPLATNRHTAVVLDQPRFPGLSPGYVGDFATTSFHSFWAQFGWMAIPAPDRLYWVWGVLMLVAGIGLLARREIFRRASWRLMAATLLTALLAYVGYNLAFQQFQGRYVFTAVVPIAALLVAGWSGWLPPRARTPAGLLIGASLVVLNTYSLARVLAPGFAPGV